MGSPDFAINTLKNLNDEHDVVAVYSQPARRSGRGKKFNNTPVIKFAIENNLNYFTPEILIEDDLIAHNADIFVVVGYGIILPQAILDIPRLGCINGHPSLLPRWRGAAPIQRSLEAGDNETGVSIILMDSGLDTGPILDKVYYPIEPKMTSEKLHEILSITTGQRIIKVIDDMMVDNIKPIPQSDSGITYANKITAKDRCLNISQQADTLTRLLQAFDFGWLETISGRMKIIEANHINNYDFEKCPHGTFLGRSKNKGIYLYCGNDTILEITKLQISGKNEMSADSFLNGYRWQNGMQIIK